MNNMLPNNVNEIIDQYKQYMESSVLRRGFDFTTWCQHQFGEPPKGITVEPRLDFSVTDTNTVHK